MTWELLPSICWGWAWGWWRWGWISCPSLCQTLDPNALPSGVRCGLAYSTVHLARLVHHILERVRGPRLTWRSLCRLHLPTDSRSPLFLLVLHCCYLPIAILGIRLLILPLVETSVVVVEIGGVVVFVVVEIVVPLDLAPLAPVG